jgi:hypothetical protein
MEKDIAENDKPNWRTGLEKWRNVVTNRQLCKCKLIHERPNRQLHNWKLINERTNRQL